MRPHLLHIVFVLVFVNVASLSAKTTTLHGVGGYLAGGYHTELLPSNSSLSRPNGVEGGIGFDYRLTVSPYGRSPKSSSAKFLFNSGLGLSVRRFGFKADAMEIELPNSVDADGDLFTFVYQLGERKDQYTRFGAVVPLMVGAEFKRLYFTVGAKLNMSLYTQSVTKMNVSSRGDYTQFLDPLIFMPEHQYFPPQELNVKQKTSLASDLMAAAEIGCLLTPINTISRRKKTAPELRLSVFADYGVVSFGSTPNANLPSLTTPQTFSVTQDMFAPIRVNHVLSTNLAGDGKITPLTVGARLILSFSYESQPPYPCHCVPDRLRYKNK